MTTVDVVYRYGTQPTEREAKALNGMREVYGIRRLTFDEKESTVRVEYDATRLDEPEVAAILRRSGLDLREKLQLI